MSTPGEEEHLDPNNPMSYAPRWMREEARSRSAAARETRGVSSPSSFDTLLSEAVGKSLRNRLDSVAIHEPPQLSQWRELIPVAARFAAAVGVSALVALFFVFMIPASRDRAQDHTQDHTQDSTASLVPAPSKAATQTRAPNEGVSKPAESKPSESKPAVAQFETILPADRTAQPADPAKTSDIRTSDIKTLDIKTSDIKTSDIKTSDIKTLDIKTPDMTHEQSEALLHQFIRWQQKLDSTDAPPQ
jgi:hypothetical protein